MLPTPIQSWHVDTLQPHHAWMARAGRAKLWFHGLQNVLVTVAERELILTRSLIKRLVNQTHPSHATEGYAADRTVEQLREPAQRIADRIDELIYTGASSKRELA